MRGDDSGRPGVFTVSIDTELVWGLFDVDTTGYLEVFERTRDAIDELLAVLDRYGVPATWAVVGHLLDDCSDHAGDADDPRRRIHDRAVELPCQDGTARELWHAPEILGAVRDAGTDHEIAAHGYTHLVLDEATCPASRAENEYAAAVAAFRAAGVEPDSYVFPRNRVGHLDVLARHGFGVFRGVDDRWFEADGVPRSLARAGRFTDELFARVPPTVAPSSRHGVVEVPGSQPFRPDRGAWRYTPDDASRRRAVAGLDRAARDGRVFHLWFHPFDLVPTSSRLEALEGILRHAVILRDRGQLRILPMRDVPDAVRVERRPTRTEEVRA